MADHDMDQQPAVAEAPPAPAPADKEQEAAHTALSETLAQLEETPDNVPLLRRSIGHMRTLGLDAELLETTQRLSKLIMLDESMSLPCSDTCEPSAAEAKVCAELIDRPMGGVFREAHSTKRSSGSGGDGGRAGSHGCS